MLKFAFFPPQGLDQVCTKSPRVEQTGHLPDSAGTEMDLS